MRHHVIASSHHRGASNFETIPAANQLSILASCQLLNQLRQLQILGIQISCQILKAAAAANILLLLFPFHYITILMQLQILGAHFQLFQILKNF